MSSRIPYDLPARSIGKAPNPDITVAPGDFTTVSCVTPEDDKFSPYPDYLVCVEVGVIEE